MAGVAPRSLGLIPQITSHLAEEIGPLPRSQPFYQSSSGDVWLLGRADDFGEIVVIHKANAASDGAQERLPVATFLSPERCHTAEAQALLQLVRSRTEPPGA